MAFQRAIAQVGNPALRQSARCVASVNDPDMQTLIDDLLLTMELAGGVGIAAPQVSAGDRLFIVASRPNARYPNAPQMEPTPMINPVIVAHSADQEKGWEGCLSVPGVRGLVPRYRWVQVEYLDRAGNLQTQHLTDFIARIFQHELDHLDGILFIDRVESDQDVLTEAAFRQQILGEAIA
jgi:peptide deformylase